MKKLSISLIIVVLTSLIALGWIINTIYQSSNTQNEDEYKHFINLSLAVKNAINNSPNPEQFIALWNQDNTVQLHMDSGENFPLPDTLNTLFLSGKPISLSSESGQSLYYLLDNNEVLSIPLPHATPTDSSHMQWLLTLSFYFGIIAVMLIWLWPLIRRLILLRKTALHFGQGDLSTRIKTDNFSYIHDIESEFNHMADRIQSLISDNKLLSRAVSHDLKTPLARLRFGVDALSETSNQVLKEKYTKRLNNDLEEMESLIAALLHYARLDEANIQLNKESIYIHILLQQLIENGSVEHISITTEFDTDTKKSVSVDKQYLSMLINNLLNNAQLYALSKVYITTNVTSKHCILTIEDDGPGIPVNEREDAQKPFWRGTQTREKKGHGMGLAIAERIAIWHNATLTISDSKTLGGAKISLTLPL